MSAETECLRIRRHGLRIAVAVAVGFTWAGLAGQVIPFLGPLFAIQMLMAPRPPGLTQGIAMLALIVVASSVMLILTEILGGRPLAYCFVLLLVYLACFVAQAAGRGGGAPFLVLVVATIVPMFAILQQDLGQSLVLVLLNGVATGLLLTWTTHALFPDPGGPAPVPAARPPEIGSIRKPFASAAILVAVVCYCLTDNTMAAAAVVPITVASLLGQLELVDRPMAVVGLMVVNLFGGVVASLAFTIYELRPTILWLFAVVLVVALLFGGKAAADRASAPMYAGALTIFCILFGLGVSPLPGSAASAFSDRVAMVLFAIAYTVTMAALLWPTTTAERRRRAATS